MDNLIWSQLKAQAASMPSLSELFRDKSRADHYSLSACDLYMDYSKQRMDAGVLNDLLKLARDKGLAFEINRLMAGEHVNDTEDRAALHTALRMPADTPLMVDGVDVNAAVHESLTHVGILAERIRSGVWRGYSGKAMTDVVNIGVGGSDLGPLMATTALAE